MAGVVRNLKKKVNTEFNSLITMLNNTSYSTPPPEKYVVKDTPVIRPQSGSIFRGITFYCSGLVDHHCRRAADVFIKDKHQEI